MNNRKGSHATDPAQTLKACIVFFNAKEGWGFAYTFVNGEFETVYIHGGGRVGSIKGIHKGTLIHIDGIIQDERTVREDERPRKRKAVTWYIVRAKQRSSYGGTRPRSKKPTSSVSSSRPQHKQRSAKN